MRPSDERNIRPDVKLTEKNDAAGADEEQDKDDDTETRGDEIPSIYPGPRHLCIRLLYDLFSKESIRKTI